MCSKWYSSPEIETPELLDFREWSETIDGRMAQLATARNQLVPAAWQFQSSVHFAVVDSNRPRVQLKVSADSVLRQAGGTQELLIPAKFNGKQAKFQVEYVW